MMCYKTVICLNKADGCFFWRFNMANPEPIDFEKEVRKRVAYNKVATEKNNIFNISFLTVREKTTMQILFLRSFLCFR